MKAISLSKKNRYKNIGISATYTQIHEKNDYSISKVITSNKNLRTTKKLSKDEMLKDILNSLNKILLNDYISNINPYLYSVFLSLIYKAKSDSFCDDLFSDLSLTYDYNGDKYNCFRNWGETKYILNENEVINQIIEKKNNKDNNEFCRLCWARNMCKICIVSLIQEEDKFIITENCSERLTFEMCLEEIIKVIQENKLILLIDNFVNTFLTYK